MGEERAEKRCFQVLIADDQPINLELLKSALEPLGLEVHEASDGREALDLAKRVKPDLVLLDVMMPKMNGLDVCKILKEESEKEGRFLPIILITAKEDLKTKLEGLEVSRADDYIVKPYELRELLARVKVMLRILMLQQSLLENERLKVLFEMAGAAAHEINQPLCAISCYVELLQSKSRKDDSISEEIQGISECVDRISDILRKLSEIKRYSTKHYLYDERIIDLELSSQH